MRMFASVDGRCSDEEVVKGGDSQVVHPSNFGFAQKSVLFNKYNIFLGI